MSGKGAGALRQSPQAAPRKSGPQLTLALPLKIRAIREKNRIARIHHAGRGRCKFHSIDHQ